MRPIKAPSRTEPPSLCEHYFSWRDTNTDEGQGGPVRVTRNTSGYDSAAHSTSKRERKGSLDRTWAADAVPKCTSCLNKHIAVNSNIDATGRGSDVGDTAVDSDVDGAAVKSDLDGTLDPGVNMVPEMGKGEEMEKMLA